MKYIKESRISIAKQSKECDNWQRKSEEIESKEKRHVIEKMKQIQHRGINKKRVQTKRTKKEAKPQTCKNEKWKAAQNQEKMNNTQIQRYETSSGAQMDEKDAGTKVFESKKLLISQKTVSCKP
jgi:hypothetical protein